METARFTVLEGYNRDNKLVSFEITSCDYKHLIQVFIDGRPQLDKSVMLNETLEGAKEYTLNYARNSFGVTELR